MRSSFFAIVIACLLVPLWVSGAWGQDAPPPAKISELVEIISDPEVKAWLERQRSQSAANMASSASIDLHSVGTDMRGRFRSLTDALPQVPGAIRGMGEKIFAEARDGALPPPLLILAGIVLLALSGEWAARRLFRSTGGSASPLVAQAVTQIGPVFVFGLVAAIVFLSFDWPPAFDAVIIHLLAAAVVFRIVLALQVVALAAGSVTQHLHRRILLFAGIVVFGLAAIGVVRAFDVDPNVQRVIAVFGSIILLVVSIEAVLTDPSPQTARSRLFKSLGLILLWVVWASGFFILFWALIYAVVLPKLLPAIDRMARGFAATRWPGDAESSIPTVLLLRGIRAIVIGLAVAWLAAVWQINPRAIGNGSTLFDAIFTGLLKSVIVILIADLGWALAKAAIRRKLATVSATDAPDLGEEAARRARLRTLLPIFQNALAATLLVVTALMVLAELGVEIGPLVAGAGVVGVAIGFGSQTLVKDVISGVFYLMDDAFRVGEYIQSGSYMGTVESFSLRSVRLRHHRGPVFTVPFGELGAVQNMSRDWVIDKFRIRVGFDTDIAKAKKLTKVVGAELLQDEELGPLLLQTVKMKGVEQIGEYGIELSFAFTAKPGNQSMIRRRAYAMIRKAFGDNAINFAQPTVHVGGDDKGDAAAGAHLAQRQRAAAEAQQDPA
ncbi:MAG: mechanosensitive ion channel family protein [Rhizobium sp.]|nr:mechanosensitive ion channel family protein [Rhizobium sp.]